MKKPKIRQETDIEEPTDDEQRQQPTQSVKVCPNK